MLPLRQRIYPDIDIELDGPEMWVNTVIRKKHSDGLYYLTQLSRTKVVAPWQEQYRNKIIHDMMREFNFAVYMYTIHIPVDLDAKNSIGCPMYVRDPDQKDDLLRVYKVA
jgi:hypothetical protein